MTALATTSLIFGLVAVLFVFALALIGHTITDLTAAKRVQMITLTVAGIGLVLLATALVLGLVQ